MLVNKHFLYGIFFFFLFYVETITIFGIKIAILWKIPLLIYMSLFILYSSKKINSYILTWGYLFNFQLLFSISAITNLVLTFSSISRSIVFPLFFHYFNKKGYSSKLKLYLKNISIFIIISTIPFLINLIEPLSVGYDLSRYGLDSFGFNGIFQKAHAASMTLSFAVIIIGYLLQKEHNKERKFYYLFLILIGLYAIVQTYVRTGLAMTIVGLFIIYYKKLSVKGFIRLFILSLIGGFLALQIYNSSEVLQMRVNEKNIYNKNENTELSIETIGSGRFLIAAYAIDNWWSEGTYSIFFGLGEPLAREKMNITKGSPVFAHNGIVEVLQTQGLIGLIIMFLFFRSIHKLIMNNKDSEYFKLNLALFLSFLTGYFLQGNDLFLVYLMFAISLTLLKKKKNMNLKISY